MYAENSEPIVDVAAVIDATKQAYAEPPRPKETFRIIGSDNSVTALFEALAQAQAEFQPIIKNKTAKVISDKGSYTFDYADLGTVIDATRPSLTAHGLAFIQPQFQTADGLIVRSILAGHGARLEADVFVPGWTTNKDGVEVRRKLQERNGEVTYVRRYQTSGMLGVFSEDDDDANAADGNAASVQPRDRSRPAPPPTQQPASAKPREVKRPPPLPQEKPADKPAETPAKASEPPPAAPVEASGSGPYTAEQRKQFSVLFREVAGFNGAKAKEFLRALIGREDPTEADGVSVIATLEVAKKLSYTADQLIEFVKSKGDQPDPMVVISDLEAEHTAFFGGNG